jgi:hypothetical protein
VNKRRKASSSEGSTSSAGSSKASSKAGRGAAASHRPAAEAADDAGGAHEQLVGAAHPRSAAQAAVEEAWVGWVAALPLLAPAGKMGSRKLGMSTVWLPDGLKQKQGRSLHNIGYQCVWITSSRFSRQTSRQAWQALKAKAGRPAGRHTGS